MKQALEALEGNCTNPAADPEQAATEDAAITALRQALETEKQEPVAVVFDPYDAHGLQWLCQHPPHRGDKLYLSPPKREWVGLTDEDEIPWDGVDAKSFARAIEAKLKEKNI